MCVMNVFECAVVYSTLGTTGAFGLGKTYTTSDASQGTVSATLIALLV